MTLYSNRELAVRRITVAKQDMVFVRNVIEASEGLGFVVAESGGDAFVMSTKSQREELDVLLADLGGEIELYVWETYSDAELERLTQ